MKLARKVAVITGAAQGLGLAYAKAFVAEGARVVLGDINDELGSAAAAEIGAAARYVHCDVTSPEDNEALMAAAMDAFGAVDISVANAGAVHHAPFLELAEEDFDRVLAINLKGPFLTGQAAARRMAAGGGGAIINIASVNAVQVNLNQVPYAVSKAAVVLLTRVMAVSLADYGIRVNAIGPGSTRTAMFDAVIDDPKALARVLSRTPLRRVAEPAEIAAVAVFLASDDSSYMTGQTLYAEGGRMVLNYMMPERTAVAGAGAGTEGGP